MNQSILRTWSQFTTDHGIISDFGFDAAKFKQKTDDNTIAPLENEIMVSNGTGECNFIKLEEDLIVAFIDAGIFEIKIALENMIEKENIILHFGNTKFIEDRAHQTLNFLQSIC